MYKTLSNLYGQIRGYNRWRIWREAVSNAMLSPELIKDLTFALFQRRVRDAIRRFPHYAERVKAFRGSLPAPGAAVEPRELPIWTKDDQRSLISDLREPPIPGSFVHRTGGSTGVPIQFYMTRESYEWRMAVSDRGYSWAGAEAGRRSFYVWSVPVAAQSISSRLKAGLLNKLQQRRMYNNFLFGEERKRLCCEEVNRFKPEVIVGYGGRLAELARFVEQHPETLSWKARVVLSAAEGLRLGDRELLERWLGREVFMSYGSREFMLIGMECQHRCGYHISSDSLMVEIVDKSGNAIPRGETGRILVTDLRNDANPFIRYEIGDLGAMGPDQCVCGLPFPLLDRVEGRLQEVLYTTTGDTLTGIFVPHLLKEFKWIKGFQVVQERLDLIRIRLISDVPPAKPDLEPITRKFHEVLGSGMVIVYDSVAELETSANGKTPPIIVRMRVDR